MLLLLLWILLLMCLTALTVDQNYQVNPAIYRFITSVIDPISILSAQSIAIFDENSIYYVFNRELPDKKKSIKFDLFPIFIITCLFVCLFVYISGSICSPWSLFQERRSSGTFPEY